MDTLLLSCRSIIGQAGKLYTDAVVTDQRLVADTTSTYQTTQGANKILTPGVAGLTASSNGIIMVVAVHFMQEASSSLPLMLKYFTKQPLRTNKQTTNFASR